jgi:hypothetical protein
VGFTKAGAERSWICGAGHQRKKNWAEKVTSKSTYGSLSVFSQMQSHACVITPAQLPRDGELGRESRGHAIMTDIGFLASHNLTPSLNTLGIQLRARKANP